jgi:hypothetical protein
VNKIYDGNIHEEESLVRNVSVEDFGGMHVEDLNCSITVFITPVKVHPISIFVW